MRKKLLIAGFMVTATVFMAWLIHQHLLPRDIDGTAAQRSTEIPEQSTPTSEAEKEVPTAEELLQDNPELAKQIQDASNSSILFYGKVIDQYSEPVSGAEVSYSYTHYETGILPAAYWSSGGGRVLTDARGRFVIKDVAGIFLSLDSVEKAGFVIRPAPELGYIVFTPRDTGEKRHSPDPSNPVIIHAWKKIETARALIDGSGFWNVKLDGQYHGLPIPRTDKAIQIRFEQNAEGDWANPLDWSVHIKVDGGGVVPTDDIFMYEAPESGYQPEWSWAAPKHGDRWPIDTRQNFYFQTDDGSIYGRMEVRFIPYYGEKNQGVIDVKYWLNPTGSRNLLPADE